MIQTAGALEAHTGPWFVIWAESRAEKKVQERLAALGLSSWLPIVRERHRWSDRWKDIEYPLFPGYLFARATTPDWPRILRTPGVLTVTTERGKPALLADSFVSALREAIGREGAAPEAVTESVHYTPGDEVIVQEGRAPRYARNRARVEERPPARAVGRGDRAGGRIHDRVGDGEGRALNSVCLHSHSGTILERFSDEPPKGSEIPCFRVYSNIRDDGFRSPSGATEIRAMASSADDWARSSGSVGLQPHSQS